MQSLFSRAAEAHICFNRVYTHVVSHSAIIRTTLQGPQCKPNHSGTFAAPYTTKPDHLAVFDTSVRNGEAPEPPTPGTRAKTKSGQRKPLLGMGPLGSSHDFEEETRPWRTPAFQALNSICVTEEVLVRHVPNRRRLNNFLLELHRNYDPRSRRSFHREYLGPNLAEVQRAVDCEQREDEVPMREPMSTLQFEKYHSMVNQMVDRLVIQSYYDETPTDSLRAHRNVESLDSAWTALRMLRSEGYPRYNHPSADSEGTIKTRDELADKIRMLFESWDVSNPGTTAKFQVAKMCYNLLVCPVPPTMHHYNLLLLGFTQKSAYNLVDIVADSFLEHSRLRPTPQTIAVLLIHYRKKKDIRGFYGIIRRMVAIDNRGMLIRRRWYEDVAKIPDLQHWARQPEVATSLKANWIIQQPWRGPDIYEALVSGLLAFDRVKDAVKVFIGSLEERIGTSIELFLYLLKSCSYALDASAADILSRGLIEHVDLVVELLLRDDCSLNLVHHLYHVVNMPNPPSAELSSERALWIWQSMTMVTGARDGGSVQRIQTAMFIRHTETYLSTLGSRLSAFENLRRAQDPKHRTIIARACLKLLNTLEYDLGLRTGLLAKHQVLHKIVRELERCTWVLNSTQDLVKAHNRIVAVLANNMPRPGKFDKAERLETMATIADNWLWYRLSKLAGVHSDAQRLLLRAGLAIDQGLRLMAKTRRLLNLMSSLDWRTLDLSHPDKGGVETTKKAQGSPEPQGSPEAQAEPGPFRWVRNRLWFD